jgi:hypothetical protein
LLTIAIAAALKRPGAGQPAAIFGHSTMLANQRPAICCL